MDLADRIDEMIEKKSDVIEGPPPSSFESRLMESVSVKLAFGYSFTRRRDAITEPAYHLEPEEEKREEVEPVSERPENAFKRTKYESPVKKSLLGQLRSVIVGADMAC